MLEDSFNSVLSSVITESVTKPIHKEVPLEDNPFARLSIEDILDLIRTRPGEDELMLLLSRLTPEQAEQLSALDADLNFEDAYEHLEEHIEEGDNAMDVDDLDLPDTVSPEWGSQADVDFDVVAFDDPEDDFEDDEDEIDDFEDDEDELDDFEDDFDLDDEDTEYDEDDFDLDDEDFEDDEDELDNFEDDDLDVFEDAFEDTKPVVRTPIIRAGTVKRPVPPPIPASKPAKIQPKPVVPAPMVESIAPPVQKQPDLKSGVDTPKSGIGKSKSAGVGEVFDPSWDLVTYITKNVRNKDARRLEVVRKYYSMDVIRREEMSGRFYISKGILRK